ncbi:MAG: erythromycin esterase [candidate division NC10 bacterium]|nr:erythromycin esterase [candidate division NC10 bacterium]
MVGLGESLHASGGYHRVIARVVRFLVEKKGFRLLAFESPWKGAEAVARYVQTGEGRAKHALQGLIPQFRSREIADLVEWLRERNRKHPQDPVRVAGFDVQQFGFRLQPDGHDATALSGFLAKLSPAEVSSVQPGLVQCGAPRKDGWPGPLSPEEYARCLRALDAVETLLDRESFVSRSSRRERELAAISATVLRHWAGFAFHRDNEFERNSHRDAGMARVLARHGSLEAIGARAVL